jgi:hypothetical protein
VAPTLPIVWPGSIGPDDLPTSPSLLFARALTWARRRESAPADGTARTVYSDREGRGGRSGGSWSNGMGDVGDDPTGASLSTTLAAGTGGWEYFGVTGEANRGAGLGVWTGDTSSKNGLKPSCMASSARGLLATDAAGDGTVVGCPSGDRGATATVAAGVAVAAAGAATAGEATGAAAGAAGAVAGAVPADVVRTAADVLRDSAVGANGLPSCARCCSPDDLLAAGARAEAAAVAARMAARAAATLDASSSCVAVSTTAPSQTSTTSLGAAGHPRDAGLGCRLLRRAWLFRFRGGRRRRRRDRWWRWPLWLDRWRRPQDRRRRRLARRRRYHDRRRRRLLRRRRHHDRRRRRLRRCRQQ